MIETVLLISRLSQKACLCCERFCLFQNVVIKIMCLASLPLKISRQTATVMP